jgi:hypothetical protein
MSAVVTWDVGGATTGGFSPADLVLTGEVHPGTAGRIIRPHTRRVLVPSRGGVHRPGDARARIPEPGAPDP